MPVVQLRSACSKLNKISTCFFMLKVEEELIQHAVKASNDYQLIMCMSISISGKRMQWHELDYVGCINIYMFFMHVHCAHSAVKQRKIIPDI